MARKSEKKYININEVNIEIDYDKLAEAIVTAQEKQTVQYSITREWMKTLLIPVFWGIAILTGLFGIAFMWQGGKTFLEAVQKGFGRCFLDACVGGAGFVIGLFFIASRWCSTRLNCTNISQSCHQIIPSNSFNPAVICFSSSCRSARISVVEGYSTATYSVFLYLLMDRS